MCEHTYAGCSNCGAPVDEMTYWCDEHRREYAHVDEDGDPSDFFDSGESETYDSGYACGRCESENTSVNTECEPEECECRECDPDTAIAEPEDDEAIVLLTRTNHRSLPDLEPDTPDEIVKLFSDRAVSVVPVRAERAAYLFDQWLPTSHATVDTTSPIPAYLEEAA